jgi:hypothetical protein
MPRYVSSVVRVTVAISCIAAVPCASSIALADTFGTPAAPQVSAQGVAGQPRLMTRAEL